MATAEESSATFADGGASGARMRSSPPERGRVSLAPRRAWSRAAGSAAAAGVYGAIVVCVVWAYLFFSSSCGCSGAKVGYALIALVLTVPLVLWPPLAMLMVELLGDGLRWRRPSTRLLARVGGLPLILAGAFALAPALAPSIGAVLESVGSDDFADRVGRGGGDVAAHVVAVLTAPSIVWAVGSPAIIGMARALERRPLVSSMVLVLLPAFAGVVLAAYVALDRVPRP